jgi:XapX domain-containing protein
MRSYLASVILGVAVGVVYGLVKVRSPAPPAIALLGLLGMLAGEQAVSLVRSQVFKAAPNSARHPIAVKRRWLTASVALRETDGLHERAEIRNTKRVFQVRGVLWGHTDAKLFPTVVA